MRRAREGSSMRLPAHFHRKRSHRTNLRARRAHHLSCVSGREIAVTPGKSRKRIISRAIRLSGVRSDARGHIFRKKSKLPCQDRNNHLLSLLHKIITYRSNKGGAVRRPLCFCRQRRLVPSPRVAIVCIACEDFFGRKTRNGGVCAE